MSKDQISEVFNNIVKSERLPIIFAGSGLSKRYTTNSYDWKELLIKCISNYSDDPLNKYKEYKEEVEHGMEYKNVNKFSVNERIGSFVERDFNKAYYRKQITELRVKEEDSPLKVYVSQLLNQYGLKEEMEDEINLFKSLKEKMLTVLTTNYDTFFEDVVFTKHEKIVGQQIFKKSEMGTIMKIHGCSSLPNSLVLTSKDYDKFQRKRRILSAKIINLFTENPVIFMGYSISDENIKAILLDIFQCLEDDEEFKKFEERLVIVIFDETVKNPLVGTYGMNIEGVEISMTKITLSDFTPLLKEMNKLKRITTLKEIQHIKDLVYDIVEDNEGEKKKLVNLVEDDEYDGDEIVVAIGKESEMLDSVGITGIQASDLFDDLINDNLESTLRGRYNLLAERQLPNLLRGNNVLPVNKYLKNVDRDNIVLEEKVINMERMMPEDFLTNSIRRRGTNYARCNYESLEEIFNAEIPYNKKFSYLVLRTVFDANVEEIQKFLQNYNEALRQINNGNTIYRKLVCILDIKKHKESA
ncbi:hypothetical protein J2S78_002083 [Salibacterium salarium]|uniref:SIR2 family protein n=1 Tax=Salibacterium salarium TaxID=284579 RepID=UPI00277F26FE|nr:SIR2 family protein [Salibacterium salarium]MDQ0299663.1 hypothetical protein [Salibacterium salarium]